MELSSFVIGIGFDSARDYSGKVVKNAVAEAVLEAIGRRIINPLNHKKQNTGVRALFKELEKEKLKFHSIGVVVFTHKAGKNQVAQIREALCKSFKVAPEKVGIKTENTKEKTATNCFAFVSLQMT